MSIKLNQKAAINWLFRHLEPEIRSGGCHLFKANPDSCQVCKANMNMLTLVKQVLKRHK